MAITPSQLSLRIDTSPGDASEISGSFSIVSGNNYFVAVAGQRTGGFPLPTLAGLSQTWTQIDTIEFETKRRLTVFHARADASSTGTVTASYTSGTTDYVSFTVVEATGATAAGWAAAYAAAFVQTSGSLAEPITMSAFADTANRPLMFVVGNTNSSPSARLELDSDSGGDADWVSFTAGGSSSPTTVHQAGWRDATNDLTPGFYSNEASLNPSCGAVAIEMEAAAEVAGSASYVGVLNAIGAAPAAPTEGLGIDTLGTSPLGG